MTKLSTLFITAMAAVIITGCQNQDLSDPTVDLATKMDTTSFALGYQNGEFLARQGAEELNYEQYLAGFVKGMAGDEVLTQEEIFGVIRSYQQEMFAQLKERNKQEGEEFLEENKSREGVQVTESGLQYRVIEEGTGASPSASDTVRVNYEGSLLDGTVFDSSYDRGQPIEFPLNRVIRGWTEGVQLMKEGATYEFYIPSEMAYGPNGAGNGMIPPNATLIFKVELIEVK